MAIPVALTNEGDETETALDRAQVDAIQASNALGELLEVDVTQEVVARLQALKAMFDKAFLRFTEIAVAA